MAEYMSQVVARSDNPFLEKSPGRKQYEDFRAQMARNNEQIVRWGDLQAGLGQSPVWLYAEGIPRRYQVKKFKPEDYAVTLDREKQDVRGFMETYGFNKMNWEVFYLNLTVDGDRTARYASYGVCSFADRKGNLGGLLWAYHLQEILAHFTGTERKVKQGVVLSVSQPMFPGIGLRYTGKPERGVITKLVQSPTVVPIHVQVDIKVQRLMAQLKQYPDDAVRRAEWEIEFTGQRFEDLEARLRHKVDLCEGYGKKGLKRLLR